ncbi:hypothetical protein PRIPAC_82609 [Pristionchus pacificus]|uniref:Uncharacterized protein n=1 Tax=Pristionchus pacificus TaxID=54126 RepID=A0A2A6C2U1_PRIPA|nr:hypothetical protein PRIPAC_82609 [Pristionchus pacificus]|eukprot:PDM72417.1 hypothetical protein PRIPAC_38851 [Pristionchus pacificus]
MFLINFLDRNSTSDYVSAFECIYAFEALFLIALLIVSYAVGTASWRSTFHLNIRLRIICIIIHSDISNAARFSVLINQVFGPEHRETTNHTIIASLIREAFLAYFTTLASIIALDRCAALFSWSWYESGVSSTLAFFVMQESILIAVAWTMSYLTVYDYITDMNLVQYCGGALLTGSILFILIYRENLSERRILRQGATVGSYAVARTFQIRESIALMKMYSRIGPLVIFCAPEFVFYPAYTLLPHGDQWNFWRHLSIALYDLWIGIISVVVLVCIPIVEPRIATNLPCIPQRLRQLLKNRNESQSFSVIKRTSSAEASMYFNMLERDLGRPSINRY